MFDIKPVIKIRTNGISHDILILNGKKSAYIKFEVHLLIARHAVQGLCCNVT